MYNLETGTRTCSGCGGMLPATLEFFYKDDRSPDGLKSHCKPCKKAYNKQWAMEHRELRAEWRAENRERVAEYQRKWREENPDKQVAKNAVNNALRDDRLAKPNCCEDCGKETRLHGHHSDYTKPLEVDWLCPPCHSKRHYKTHTQAPQRGHSTHRQIKIR